MFDDALVESPELVADQQLRWLATTGARLREAASATEAVRLDRLERPRAMVLVGRGAGMLRAALESVCPVPVVRWSRPGLPGWVSALDFVVVLGGEAAGKAELQAVQDAARRGAGLLVAAPTDSQLAVTAQSTRSMWFPVADDELSQTMTVLARLGEFGLGPHVLLEHLADAADLVAAECSPRLDSSQNPAKNLALGIGDELPLLWGGTRLAAVAARKLAIKFRSASGQPALAADAAQLAVLVRQSRRRDLFSDPIEEQTAAAPVLVLLDDQVADEQRGADGEWLAELAANFGVPSCRISSGAAEPAISASQRYVMLLQYGRYAAAYLRAGMGEADEQIWQTPTL